MYIGARNDEEEALLIKYVEKLSQPGFNTSSECATNMEQKIRVVSRMKLILCFLSGRDSLRQGKGDWWRNQNEEQVWKLAFTERLRQWGALGIEDYAAIRVVTGFQLYEEKNGAESSQFSADAGRRRAAGIAGARDGMCLYQEVTTGDEEVSRSWVRLRQVSERLGMLLA